MANGSRATTLRNIRSFIRQVSSFFFAQNMHSNVYLIYNQRAFPPLLHIFFSLFYSCSQFSFSSVFFSLCCRTIAPKSYIVISLKVQPHQCESVNFLEHVQAKITLTSQRRGDIQIYLTSPAGTKVTLLTSR